MALLTSALGRRRAAALGTACALFALATPALSYRTSADVEGFDGIAARWKTASVGFYFHSDGAPGLSLVETQAQTVEAWHAWEEPTCSAVDLTNLGAQASPAEPGDGRNTIQWVSDWTARGFDASAAGATDVQYERSDGMWWIVEADIYLNAQHFTWATHAATGDGDADARSVLLVLRHEMSHALGIWHPCEPDGLDGAPDCALHPEHDDSIVHPIYDLARSTLSADDRAAICALYPNETCETTGCPSGFTCTERGCEMPCSPACADGARCLAGQCVGGPSDAVCPEGADCSFEGPRGTASFADPCVSGADCLSGVCAGLVDGGSQSPSMDRTCSASCSFDDDCSLWQGTCDAGLCVADLTGLGTPCSESNQCLGNECLRIDDDPPVCTRRCEGHAECPGDWTCEPVQDRRVCAPPGPVYVAGGGGSCSVRAPARSGPLAALGLGAVLILIGRLRHRLATNRGLPLAETTSHNADGHPTRNATRNP